MRHRRKLIGGTLLLTASFATWFFWPHTNPDARRALARLREMVEIDATGAAPEAAEGKPREDVQIELCFVIATINMTDATAGLFAQPGRVGAETVTGRASSFENALATLKSAGVLDIKSVPRMTTLWGQRSMIAAGSEAVMVAPAPANGMPPLVSYRDVGMTFSALTLPGASGGIFLEMEAELSHLGQRKKVATAQGPMDVPQVFAHKAKVRAELKPGETLVIGGLSQKRPERVLVRIPGLSDIPGIGTWFTFRRQREIEEELVILVRPRILASEANQPRQPPAPPTVATPTTRRKPGA